MLYNGLSISILIYIIHELSDTKYSFTRLCVYGIGQRRRERKERNKTTGLGAIDKKRKRGKRGGKDRIEILKHQTRPDQTRPQPASRKQTNQQTIKPDQTVPTLYLSICMYVCFVLVISRIRGGGEWIRKQVKHERNATQK